MPLDVKFSAANTPMTGGPTGQTVWDYLFGHIIPGALNKLGLPVVKTRVLKQAERAIISSVEAILIPAIQDNLVRNDNIFRQDLHDSFTTRVREPGTVSLVSESPYAMNVERGSEPRNISSEEMQNLVEWAEFKFPEQDAEQVAGLVAAAIKESGNDAHPYIEDALEDTGDLVLENVQVSFA
jgi:hypothetical protein